MNDELQFPEFDDEGKVVCQICGKSYQVISPRHLAVAHKIEYADYTKRYPSAPLSSEQFIIKSKYARNNKMFVQEKDLTDDIMEEEVMVYEEPELEEIEFETSLQKIVDEVKDPVQVQKMRVFDHLRLHFANVEKDYMISHKSPISGKLMFQFITDFCDPVLKIVIQFPNTFWHNIDTNPDPLKYEKLETEKWKVLKIKGSNPSAKDIDKVIDRM